MAKTIYRDEYRDLVCQLRKARESIGLSQAGLAQKLGRNQQWVSQMESGSRRLDVIEFAEVCIAIGIDPAGTLDSVTRSIGRGLAAPSRRRDSN